jgi:hypothetical protein
VIELKGFNDTVKVTGGGGANATSVGTLRLLGGRIQIVEGSKLVVTELVGDTCLIIKRTYSHLLFSAACLS